MEAQTSNPGERLKAHVCLAEENMSEIATLVYVGVHPTNKAHKYYFANGEDRVIIASSKLSPMQLSQRQVLNRNNIVDLTVYSRGEKGFDLAKFILEEK